MPPSQPGRAFVGTSGWIYKHWNGRFYPEGLPGKRQLAYMAERFSTVEVNGTFYSLSRPSASPNGAATCRPTSCSRSRAAAISRTCSSCPSRDAPLAQLLRAGRPAAWARSSDRFCGSCRRCSGSTPTRSRAFLDLLPRDLAEAERLARKHDERAQRPQRAARTRRHDRPLRHALEIRHASWLDEEALQLCAEYDVALVTADTADHHPLSMERTTDDFAYVRLHGARKLYASRYTDEELDEWAALVDGWRAAAATCTSTSTTTTRPTPRATPGASVDRLDPRLGDSPVDAHL